MSKQKLLDFIKLTVVDWKYQTIELQGKVEVSGYSKSSISWNNIIKTGIQFLGKSVCDIGCFFGYFCCKAEEAGASKVVGYDQSCTVLEVAKKITTYNNLKSIFETRIINGDFVFPEKFDVILTLNMLHHIRKLCDETTFTKIIREIFLNCREAVFEVNENEISIITEEGKKEGFVIKNSVVSHRKTQYGNRTILYFKKEN